MSGWNRGSTNVGYAATVLGDGPLGFWMLDETSGTTVTDSSGAGLTLTHYNGVAPSSDGPGSLLPRCAYYDGSNDITRNSNTAVLNQSPAGSWSAEWWMKTTFGVTGYTFRVAQLTNGDATQRLIECGMNSGGTVFGYIGAVSVTSSQTVHDGKWHHIAITAVAGGAMSLYVDGALSVSTSAARVSNSSSKAAQIGAAYNNGPLVTLYKGYLAAVAFYDKTLSPVQVNAHYQAGKV